MAWSVFRETMGYLFQRTLRRTNAKASDFTSRTQKTTNHIVSESATSIRNRLFGVKIPPAAAVTDLNINQLKLLCEKFNIPTDMCFTQSDFVAILKNQGYFDTTGVKRPIVPRASPEVEEKTGFDWASIEGRKKAAKTKQGYKEVMSEFEGEYGAQGQRWWHEFEKDKKNDT